VGIDNGGSTDKTTDPVRDRANEFLPYPDGGFGLDRYDPIPPNPQGQRYPDFLIGEVMPLIERTYRVHTGPAHAAIGGFSYGGVAALYAVISRPGVFGGLLLESTPLWIGPEKELIRDARAATTWPERVYIGLGTLESPQESIRLEGRRDRDSLVAIIRRRSPASELKLMLEEGARHEPAAWRGRLPEAVRALFGRRP
jgi:predicted alpha/beta superfamily hydrolase